MVGKVLAQYRITEKLGEAGIGIVWKARDTHLDRFVAIKILPPEKVSDPERKRRFVQEAKDHSIHGCRYSFCGIFCRKPAPPRLLLNIEKRKPSNRSPANGPGSGRPSVSCDYPKNKHAA
jgi:serine/threonine protein kinase